jgi:hypothetical protein
VAEIDWPVAKKAVESSPIKPNQTKSNQKGRLMQV